MQNIFCPKCKTWWLQQLKANLAELICTKCGTHYKIQEISFLDRTLGSVFGNKKKAGT